MSDLSRTFLDGKEPQKERETPISLHGALVDQHPVRQNCFVDKEQIGAQKKQAKNQCETKDEFVEKQDQVVQKSQSNEAPQEEEK